MITFNPIKIDSIWVEFFLFLNLGLTKFSVSSLELELINIIDQLGRLTCYINQSPFPITVVTDAKNILFLIKSQISGPNPKLCRLAGRLANYDINFKLEYQKPDKNDKFLLSDFISRAYDPADNEFASIPMASLRKIEKKDICHTLVEGKTYSYTELTDLAWKNPLWFPNFPLPCHNEKHDEFDTSDPELFPETSPILPSDIHPKTIIRSLWNMSGKWTVSFTKCISGKYYRIFSCTAWSFRLWETVKNYQFNLF